MEYLWAAHGMPMNLTRTACRIGCPWDDHGMSVDCPCTAYRMSLGRAWTVHGMPIELPIEWP